MNKVNKGLVLFLPILTIIIVSAVFVLHRKHGNVSVTQRVPSKKESGKKQVIVIGNTAGVEGSGPGDTPWPMYQGSVRRTGRSQFVGPARGIIKWKFPINGIFEASPVIGIDGTIYMGGHNAWFYAVSPDGRLRWAFQTRDVDRNSVAIASDGTIYLPSADHSLYALSPEGKVKWVFTAGDRVDSSPAIGSDGVIYFGSIDSNLYSLNPDGTLRWKAAIGAVSASSPSIADDGTIYIGAYDWCLYAINKDGSIKWKFTADSGLRAAPAIGKDGTIYIGSRKGTFYAMSPDGNLKWSYKTANDIRGSAAVAEDGTVYIGSWDNYFYAFFANGRLKWRYETGGPIEASAIVDAKGNIYVGSMADKIYAFDPDGKVLWTINGGIINTAPAVGTDGTMYIGREHHLLAIGEPYPIIELQVIKKEGANNGFTLKAKVFNESIEDKNVDIKVFMKTPGGGVISLEGMRTVLKKGNTVEKVYELPIGNSNDPQGNYFIGGRIIDAEDGTLLAEDSKVVTFK